MLHTYFYTYIYVVYCPASFHDVKCTGRSPSQPMSWEILNAGRVLVIATYMLRIAVAHTAFTSITTTTVSLPCQIPRGYRKLYPRRPTSHHWHFETESICIRDTTHHNRRQTMVSMILSARSCSTPHHIVRCCKHITSHHITSHHLASLHLTSLLVGCCCCCDMM
jgi:hypothetical protein